jgi:hypothetical protein
MKKLRKLNKLLNESNYTFNSDQDDVGGGFPDLNIQDGVLLRGRENEWHDLDNSGEVIIPEGVTKIDDFAFEGSKITKVVFPKSLLEIGYGAFEWCENLKGMLHFPRNLREIGGAAFMGSGVGWVSLPRSVQDAGSQAFAQCDNLTAFILRSDCAYDSRLFFEESHNLKHVVLSDDTSALGDYMFVRCKRLESIELPEGLEAINEGAFEDTGLTEIYIPDSVSFIGRFAFRNCPRLRTISIRRELYKKEYGTLYDRCLSKNVRVIKR